MLRVGIIGSGMIARIRHAPEYSDNKRVAIRGFFDSKAEQAQALALQFGGPAYDSLQEMLDDKQIDAVSVCVANAAHAEVSIAALRAGKHVLCEKPMAVTLEECEAMVAEAKKAGRILMIGHNQRFDPAHIRGRQMIAAGRIGRPLSFRSIFGHPGPDAWVGDANPWFFSRERASFGALADLGIHKTDILHYLLDEPIVKVSASIKTLDKRFPDGSPIDVEDNALCLYETRSGAFGTVQASWTFYGAEENSTLIYGTEGCLRFYDDPDYALIFEPKKGKKELLRLGSMQSNEEQKKGRAPSTGVIDEFVDSVLNKRRPLIDGEEALKAMRVIFAALESAGRGCEVAVEQP